MPSVMRGPDGLLCRSTVIERQTGRADHRVDAVGHGAQLQLRPAAHERDGTRRTQVRHRDRL